MSNDRTENRNPLQRDFFNEKAEIWDKISVHDLKKVDYIVSLFEIRGDERILDVGTGTGVMIPFYALRLKTGSVTAVDYSEKMIEIASSKHPREEYPNVEFLVSDLYDLDCPECYDMIICYSCFPHFPNQPLAVKHLTKMLRPGGLFSIAHSSSRHKINRVHNEGGMEISNDFLPSMKELSEMTENAGLKVKFEQYDDEYFILIAKSPNEMQNDLKKAIFYEGNK